MANINGLKEQISKIEEEILQAFAKINGDQLEVELAELTKKMSDSDFWKDNQQAALISKRHSKLEQRLGPWHTLISNIKELQELSEMSDSTLETEITKNLELIQNNFSSLKNELKLSGEYDDHDAVVSIHSGTGGTDAQDWAEILERMYLRWAEKNRMKVEVIDRSVGDEAGIKSVDMVVSGKFAFGKLKGEHGVHRLVRLSPFNADKLRQTSFAKVEVSPKVESPNEVEIDDKDLKIDVYRSGGKGGQSVNTTDSAVRITHTPTGIVIAIQNERSQLQNRETAMTILRSRLAQLKLEQHAATISQLKGPNEQASWGNQIRSYVLHPYKMVKDLRTEYETSDTEGVLNGDLDKFIEAYLEYSLGENNG